MTEILAKPISIEALHSRIVNIIKEPRPFIKAKHYFGPDRRRGRRAKKYEGPHRREDDADEGSDDDAA